MGIWTRGQCGATEAWCESSTYQSAGSVGSLSTSQMACSDNVMILKYINHHGSMRSHGPHHFVQKIIRWAYPLQFHKEYFTCCNSTMVCWTYCHDAWTSGVCTQKWCLRFGKSLAGHRQISLPMPNSLIVGCGSSWLSWRVFWLRM